MYCVYTDTDHDGILRIRYTGVVVTTRSDGSLLKTPVFGFDGYFDNAGSKAWGLDLMFEPGNDTNLRAGIVYKIGDHKQRMSFMPLADGIVDSYYLGSNDWQAFGLTTCAAVANPDGLVANPMPCF